jgi:hypothetical protein
VCGLEIQRRGETETETELESGIMSSPSNATKWMSYLAEGFLAEEEVQPSTPFFWCNGQQPVGQVDCRYLLTSFFRVLLTDEDLRPMQVADYWGTAETSVLIDIFS